MATLDIEVRERDVFARMEVRVQIKRDWRVRIELVLMKWGVWLTGAQLVEEFPMSLIQDGEPVEVDHGGR